MKNITFWQMLNDLGFFHHMVEKNRPNILSKEKTVKFTFLSIEKAVKNNGFVITEKSQQKNVISRSLSCAEHEYIYSLYV